MAELIEAQVSRYHEYKPTGVEWMPEIPVEWEMRKVGHSFHTIGSGTTPNTDNNLYYRDAEINWINTGDLNDGYLLETKKKVSKAALEELSALKVYPSGSLIVAMYGATIGKLAITAIEGCANQACAVLANSPIFSIRYAFYWFLASKQHILTLASGGGQPNINQELIRSLRMPCPTEEEQEAIISFLDEKTAQLDQLITQKQQMLALLREERAALINHAVTKGLDATAPLRDSGVEWLGEVPAHWEVKRLKYFCKINPAKGQAEIGSDEVVTFLPMEKVSEEGDVDTSLSKTFKEVQTGYTYFEVGDTLVAKITPCFENGKGAFLNSLPTQVGFGSTEFHVLRPSGKILGEFLFLLIKTDMFARMGEASMIGSAGQKRVPTSFIEDFPVAAPPIHEQEGMLIELRKKTKRYVETTDTINQEIALLQEYRAALIAEAVTGQLDVRNYVPAQVPVLM